MSASLMLEPLPSQRAPGRDGVPRVPRHPRVNRGEQRPLDWRVGQQAMLEADAGLKVAVELSIRTALEALPEGPMRDDEDVFECALCLEDAFPGDRVRTLGCDHRFHTSCIDHWLCEEQCFKERRCPLCNADPLKVADSTLSKPVSSSPDRLGAGSSSSAPPRGDDSAHRRPATHHQNQRRRHDDARAGSNAVSTNEGGIFWGGVPVSELLPRRLFVDDSPSRPHLDRHPLTPTPSPPPSRDSLRRSGALDEAGQTTHRHTQRPQREGATSLRGGPARGGGGALGLLLC